MDLGVGITRRGVRRLFNKCRSDKNPHSWNSIERLSGNRGRKKGRLLKMLGGFSVVPLMTYLGQLGYTGLLTGTLRLSWDLWWLLRVGVRSLK